MPSIPSITYPSLILRDNISMQQVQNLNSEEERVFNMLTAISEDIIAYSKANREYKLLLRLTDVYTYIYNQCISKPNKSQNMFNKYKEILSLHFIKSATLEFRDNIFKETNKLWESYIKFSTILAKHAFTYLDRYFLPSRQHGNLIDVSVTIFDKHLFGSAVKKQIYIDRFVISLGTMRKNMVVTENYLYQFVKQLYAINTDLYFEIKKAYFEETRFFYASKFNDSKHLDPISYYNRINNLIYFEEAISQLCLYWTRQENLKERVVLPIIFTKELVEPYTDIFLSHHKGLHWALKEFNIPLLNIVTDIYSKFQGFEKIKKCYYDYVIQESKSLLFGLQQHKDQAKIVHCISQFFHKHQLILTAGFKKHEQIYVTLSNALQFCIGKWEKLPQILFRFCEKVISLRQFEHNAVLIRSVFEKISSKDELIHKCETWVQSTILSDKTELDEQHKFVNFLHQLCGSQNTSKLNKLFCDYIQQNQDRANPNHFMCKVISHHLWERRFKEEVAVCLTIPTFLDNQCSAYLSNFETSHPKKKLRLLPLSSRLLLQLRFGNNKLLKIKCNLLQASIIFSLEQQPKTEEELILHLNTEKHLITSYVASAKFINTGGDKLSIDQNSAQEGSRDYTEQFQQKSKFIKAIEQDRNILLQAGIVRLIKRRKQVFFQEIFDYLCSTIKLFRPQPHMVKTTIQKLTKREFIEANEQGLYIYKQ